MPLAAYGYGLAAAAYFVLLTLLSTGWRSRFQGSQLLFAVAGSLLWSLVAAVHAISGLPSSEWVASAEVARNLLWVFFLLYLLRPIAHGNLPYRRALRYTRRACLVLGLLMWLVLIEIPGIEAPGLATEQREAFLPLGQLLFVVLGLVLIEQLFRNTPVEQRWGIKHLCFGLGALFVVDLYLYTDALLFQRVDNTIWSARGLVHLFVVPLIAVTAARNPAWKLPLYLSRRMVWHTTTLFTASAYMLLMALAGYYIRIYGGAWGGVLQIAFLFGAVIVLVVLLFSGSFRAHTKVFFNKHFFSYRYDYREEWLRVIGLLAGQRRDLPLYERVIWALAGIVDSAGGVLWLRTEKGSYRYKARFNSQQVVDELIDADSPMLVFLDQERWVIDLNEFREGPDIYGDLVLPGWLLDGGDNWLVVPLILDERLLGFVLLRQPRAALAINWENLDLLKTVGVQAASYLALNQAAEALAEARQFEGFNRLSAFVMHDLKNLIAQLSLVARNAVRHRHNPEFIDDAVKTIENAVAKMNGLMIQLQTADVTGQRRRVDLLQELRDLVVAKSARLPRPELHCEVDGAYVLADQDRLSAVIGHVVQNAQDATPHDGRVDVLLRVADRHAIVEVRDTGAGMDAEFLQTRLFRPFDSTKGLTGMGIGAYECREVISALGGQVYVDSRPGVGTRFSISLPLAGELESP